MPDTSDILDILGRNQAALDRKNRFHLFGMNTIPSIEDQAKQMYQGALKAPFTPPNTGSPWKDFAQQVLELGPLALRANIPNVKPPSAMDLSLQPGVKSNLGVTQPSGAGIAENANRYNPGVNPVLDFLSKESIPINNIKDTPGGTTYIQASNPHAPNDNITIRVPNDQHIGTRGYRYNPGDLFDLGTKPVKGGGQKPNYTQNASGEKYGENPQALEDAIKYRFSKDLVSPGREPKSRLEKPENPTLTEHDPNQLDFNLETQKLHDLIDQVSGKGMPEEPNYHPYNSPIMENPIKGVSDWKEPFQIQKIGNIESPGEPANLNNKLFKTIDEWHNHPDTQKLLKDMKEWSAEDIARNDPRNMEKPQITNREMREQSNRVSSMGQLDKDPTEMVAANTGQRPAVPDVLGNLLGRTENGKYQIEVMRQQLKRKGVDPTNMSYMAMFKALNPDLFK